MPLAGDIFDPLPALDTAMFVNGALVGMLIFFGVVRLLAASLIIRAPWRIRAQEGVALASRMKRTKLDNGTSGRWSRM